MVVFKSWFYMFLFVVSLVPPNAYLTGWKIINALTFMVLLFHRSKEDLGFNGLRCEVCFLGAKQ